MVMGCFGFDGAVPDWFVTFCPDNEFTVDRNRRKRSRLSLNRNCTGTTVTLAAGRSFDARNAPNAPATAALRLCRDSKYILPAGFHQEFGFFQWLRGRRGLRKLVLALVGRAFEIVDRDEAAHRHNRD